MEKNVGGIDRVVRIVVGLGLLSLLFLLEGEQPLVGAGRARSARAPAHLGWCPAYLPFGIKTCKTA